MNKVIITNARLVKDVDLKETKNGKQIAEFTIAVNRQFNKDETDFINCIAFGKTGETISKYFHKGSPINVEGTLQISKYVSEKYMDNNGKFATMYQAKVVINNFEFVSGSKSEQSTDNKPSNNNFEPDLTPVDDMDIPF